MELITKLHGANWVGLPESLDTGLDVRKNQIAFFKNVFRAPKNSNMELHVSAHNRYKLWINDKRVTLGPCLGDPWRHYYESVDVSEYLIDGDNVIAAEVAYYPPNQYMNDRSGGPASIFTNVFGPWLIIKGILKNSNDIEISDVSTGKSDWYVTLSKAHTWHKFESTTYTVVGDFEEVSGTLIPKNWKTDSNYIDFEKARINWRADGTYFGELLPFTLNARTIPLLNDIKRSFIREMPLLGNSTPIIFNSMDKLTLEVNTSYVSELDAGELTTGYLNIRTHGGLGSKVVITYAESYAKEGNQQYPIKGVRDDAQNFSILGYQDIYYPPSEDFVYEPFWFRTFRFIKIEITTGRVPLELYSPCYHETGYPLNVVSEIEASEPWIKSLWDISIRTMKRCMHETYYDCPYYEQLQYILDTRLEILFTYAMTDDLSLPIKAIEDFHSSLLPSGQLMCRYPSASRHVMPLFSLQWILMLEDYYNHTGKTDLIIRYRSTIDAILAWFSRKKDKNNLVGNFGHWHFVDWVEEWENEDGIATGTPNAAAFGPLTYDNLVLITSLRAASKLMDITGRSGAAAEYIKFADDIEKAVNETCFDETSGLYADGPGFMEFSQHCQVWAVLSNVAKGKRQKDILIKSLEKSDIAQCSYAASYFLFRAFEAAGIYAKTWPLWNNWKQLLELNLTTWPEDLTRHRSDCHGWGSLPLYEFTRKILGVKPSAPGYKSIVIEPEFTGLEYACGKVCTPVGIVDIKWYISDDSVRITGNVPELIPFKLKIGGKTVLDSLQGGSFTFQKELLNILF